MFNADYHPLQRGRGNFHVDRFPLQRGRGLGGLFASMFQKDTSVWKVFLKKQAKTLFNQKRVKVF